MVKTLRRWLMWLMFPKLGWVVTYDHGHWSGRRINYFEDGTDDRWLA
jgi:hypothetical protein